MGDYVSLADVATDFWNSDRGKEVLAELKREEAESPARFHRKHDLKMIQASEAADVNFSCAMYRFRAITEMRRQFERSFEIDEELFDELYEEYLQYALDSAEHIREYRDRVAVLDQAIIDEDAQRERE